ncbi:beta-1,3-galactosyltransferase 1-like [Branchiostoma floridae]|uniref:Hexosyltransferase n=1 Tax=Branchiostoma floridae TaxID=7739 RepID=A0A9J7L2D1_BRAFL|nr:beta-1,3-galactosyltransferase 1-like [Branchiostoma floridae]
MVHISLSLYLVLLYSNRGQTGIAMIRRRFRFTLKVFFIACIVAGGFHLHLLQRHLHRAERRKQLGRMTSDLTDSVRGQLVNLSVETLAPQSVLRTFDLVDDVGGQLMNISTEDLEPPSVVRTNGRTLHAESNQNVPEETKAQLNTATKGDASGSESVSEDFRIVNTPEKRKVQMNTTVQGNGSGSKSVSEDLSVVNPHPYTFTINNPDKCAGKHVFLLMIVTSSPTNHAQRHVIRHTWGNTHVRNSPDITIVTMFAVGKTNDVITQRALEYENKIQQDIIQEDFVDSYRNLTLKTVMCLKWASEFCPKARFVMKADDDTFVNIYSLLNYLKNLHTLRREKLLMGHVFYDAKPIRDRKGKDKKWYLSHKDYPRETFPNYTCGFAYVMSKDIIRPLFQASLTVKYIFLEDVYIGLCLEKLGIEPDHQVGFRTYKAPSTSCTSVKQLAGHWFKTPEDMTKAWDVLNKSC